MRSLRILLLFLFLLLLIILPYIFAFTTQGEDHVFSGFLVNPLDGNSYLAKMMEGYQGRWLFTLPYSQNPGSGEYIFLFYLFLGHLARVTGLSLIATFHITRVLSVVFLFLVLYQFLRDYFDEEKEKIGLTLMIVILGSGLGWLLTPLGIKTSDLWVAEAFPLLASFQNPHFPLGLGLMILTILQFFRKQNKFSLFFIFICGAALAIILPFGAVVVGSVLLVQQVWVWIRKKEIHPFKLLILALATLPLVVYQYLAVATSPELAIWNSQNLTPSPPIWDLLISFSPAMVLAGLSITKKFQVRNSELFTTLITWLILGAIIIYLPIGIQRRFMVGYYIPVSILACTFLLSFPKRKTRILGISALLALTSLTIIIVFMAGFSAILNKNPLIFLTKPEYEAVQWLKLNSKSGALILADSRMGMFLPGLTNSRVIYGHPFETINAMGKKQTVEDFFNCQYGLDEGSNYLSDNGVNYIFVSNVNLRECYYQILNDADIVFHAGDSSNFVEIYRLR